MKIAYKFRAHPSKKQKEILNRQIHFSKELLRDNWKVMPLETL
jgi:transposase